MQGQAYIPERHVRTDMLRRPLMFSAAAHVALAVAGIAVTLFRSQGDVWGSGAGGGSASVRLVSSASIPLPPPEISTQNKVATEEKALNYSEAPPKPEPKPAPKAVDPETIDLPSQNAKIAQPKKQPEKPPEKIKEEPPKQRRELATTGQGQPTQEARLRRPANANPLGNEIPSGAGGPVQGPYGAIQSNIGSGGVSVGGDFGSKFGWYVDAIRQRISNNWLQASIDPNIRVAPRVFVTFQILRDGRVVNPELRNSSGISSLDRSALRAVYDSSPMQPLPPGYAGSSVAVEFWFDLKR
jgi:periplasmic protein TonB